MLILVYNYKTVSAQADHRLTQHVHVYNRGLGFIWFNKYPFGAINDMLA